MVKNYHLSALVLAFVGLQTCAAIPTGNAASGKCRKTSVAILGGGVAGITAAQALHNASISDFLIVEYQDDIGGRMKHTNFGTKADGSPYVVELGANWVFFLFLYIQELYLF